MLPGLTPEEARDLILSIGTHHGSRRLSPCEVADLFQKSLTAGATAQDCARYVNLTGPTMVSRFLRLLKLSPAIRHVVDWGQTRASIAFASAWPLADLTAAEQEVVAAEIMSNQMGKEEVRQIIQLQKRSRRRIKDCIQDVLRMRPVVTRRHVFLGAVTDPLTMQALDRMKQTDRDALLSKVLNAVYGQPEIASGRLGTRRFTIVSDEAGAVQLKSGVADFEVAINRELAARLCNS